MTGLVLLLSALAICGETAAATASQAGEQLQFSAEDKSVKAPVPIPEDVAAVLGRDDFVRNVMENEAPPLHQVPSSWFSASAIHLSNARKSDLLVMSVGPVHGANVTLFWVFRSRAHAHQLVLRTSCLGFQFKPARWNGYREVECDVVVMQKVSTVLYRFDGKQYVQYASKLEKIP